MYCELGYLNPVYKLKPQISHNTLLLFGVVVDTLLININVYN